MPPVRPRVAAVDGVVASLPGHELLAIEFLDARGPDGDVRKYRVVCVDGRLFPVHLAIDSGVFTGAVFFVFTTKRSRATNVSVQSPTSAVPSGMSSGSGF